MAKKVASASRTKRTQRKMNEEIVSKYVARLLQALEDDTAFGEVFAQLEQDGLVHQIEAVGIASRFVAPTPNSTSRSKALEKVHKRHSSLKSFKLKQRAMAGRSAA